MSAPHDTAPGFGPADVRPLGLRDVAQVVLLERLLFGPSAWSEALVREEVVGPGRWYVGVDAPTRIGHGAGNLVAYAGLWFDGDVAQVMTIGVVPAVRRRGLGSMLVTALVERSRQVGADAVLLEVRVDNDAAIGLYQRLGFVLLGRRRRYYQPEDVDAFTMRLSLTDPPPVGPGSDALGSTGAPDTYPGHHA